MIQLPCMRKNLSWVFYVLGLITFQQAYGQIYQGQEAGRLIKNAEWVRKEPHSEVPSFIRFNKENNLKDSQIQAVFQDIFKLPTDYGYRFINEHTDSHRVRHQRFQQTWKGIPMEGTMFLVHSEGGKVNTINGDVFDKLNLNTTPSISEKSGLDATLSYINASEYAWEKWQNTQNPTLKQWSNKPKAELCLVPLNGNFNKPEWKLAYKYDIYALKPLLRKWVYIDAHNGEVVWEHTQLHSADTPGTAVTRYSGTQNIVTDSHNGGFRLREAGRSGVETYNMNQDTDYANAVDFTDGDNNWNNTNNMDEAATDAHWAAEMVYDYYYNEQNRNSIDDNGMKFISYIHYDVGYFNAFWNGQFATFGDGNANPLTTLDICAHEFTHGVTGNSAGLIYQNESGALNEAFSDIFGTTIEFYARPSNADWLIAGDFGQMNYMRSMSNPKVKNNPDTYQGIYWYVGTGDNGGVHNNSGVLNKWFYLLTVGANGTNDLGNNYNVTGIGIEKAAGIAYKTLNDYLTPSSEYIDTRFYSLVATMDLYGACSPELEAVTNAWYGVGIGVPYTPIVNAFFQTAQQQFCSPQAVTFYNFSANADVFFWDFGDGSSSNSASPVINHSYNANGSYTVTLIAASACGNDTIALDNYIQIGPQYPCVVTMSENNATQTNCTGILYDNGGPNQYYSADFDEKIVIAPSNAYKIDLSFTTFRLASTDSLFIYKGNNQNAPLIGKYSILMLQNTTLSINSPSVTIRLRSDGMAEDSGFVCTWTCYQITGAPVADFTTLNHSSTSCNGLIYFKDLSQQATSGWNWNFGDGATSTLQNPIHEYTQNGTYTVTLNVSNPMGTDTESKSAYITVNKPPAPLANDVFVCGGNSGLLTASGSGELNWFLPTGTWVNAGSTWNATTQGTAISYLVKDYLIGNVSTGGRANNSGNGNYYGLHDKAMIFDVLTPCMLHTVEIYAQDFGNKTITLKDEFGTILESRAVALNPGYNKVTLNFLINPAIGLQLGVSGTNLGLWRNTSGSSYPYDIGNYLSIQKSNAMNFSQYYFFYNWEVTDIPCISLPKTVTLYANGTPPLSQFSFNQNLNNFVFDATSSQGAQNYFWDFGDGGTATGATPPYTYTNTGAFNVSCIVSNGGCTDTMTQTVNINQLSDISEQENLFALSLYPNPGNGEFVLTGILSDNTPAKILVVNMNGEILADYLMNTQGHFTLPFSLRDFASGVYRVQVISEKGSSGITYILR